MIRKAHIFIDIDDCVADTQRSFQKCLVGAFGKQEKYKMLKYAWEMEEILSPEELECVWGNIIGYGSSYFHHHLRIKPHARSVVRELQLQNHVFFLTDAPLEIRNYRNAFIAKHFGGYAYTIYTSHPRTKSLDNLPSKSARIREQIYNRRNGINCKFYAIEDSPFHIEEMCKIAKLNKVIVFDMPYNQDLRHRKIHRVTNWKQVREFFE